jgi:hypothetical protein
MKKWHVSNISKAKYLGPAEFQDDAKEWHDFEILQTSTRLVFGGATNSGFLESGYMVIDTTFSLDENVQELMEDLETYYKYGKQYTSRIICNERM